MFKYLPIKHNPMISINGSFLEGGGQIVRTALALSVLTGQGFEVRDIRKGRKQSGLKPQHINAIKALQELCNATVEGNTAGSEYLKFIPKKFRPKNMMIDIGTAGSITLLMQSLLPPLVLSQRKTKLTLLGGTDTEWAMPIDYFKNVFIPNLKPYADIEINLLKRGYYPKGGGHVEIIINPKFDTKTRVLASKFNLLEKDKLICIKGISHASKDLEAAEVAMRQKKSAEITLMQKTDIAAEYCNTLSTGSGITLWAVYENAILGADALGERGKKAENIGFEAAKSLQEEMILGKAVDRHLADNLIPFLGLFGGAIAATEITKHTLTNIYVTELFLGIKFDINKKDNIIQLTEQNKK